MRLCGVIAEYNPFHNGHAWQLEQAHRLSGCDYLIVCMDGGMTQRGDVALLDKWTRTRMALLHGADLVVELPALFAVRPADQFALGGVMTLGALGIDALCFGCETDDMALLQRLHKAFHASDSDLEEDVKRRLLEGKSHARSRGEAVAESLGVDRALIASPNVTLALEYMRAAEQAGCLQKEIALYPVARRGSYHDQTLHAFASASAIRTAVLSGQNGWQDAMPSDCARLLGDCLQSGRWADPTALDTTLLYLLRQGAPLYELCDVAEGFENLFERRAQSCSSRAELIAAVKSKRYTYARLNRFCAHALLKLTRADAEAHPLPEYVRVLGFRENARPLLRHLKKSASLPLIADAARLKNHPLFAFDRAATDLQSLSMRAPAFRAAAQDLTAAPVIL